MSTHSRTTTIRASEAPPSITSSHRPRTHRSENHTTAKDMQLVSYQRPRSHISRPSKHSRSPSTASLRLVSPADFPLPRSARRVPLPPVEPGSRIAVTITRPEEEEEPSRSSYHSTSSPRYTKRVTETYVFSPRNSRPKEYSQPPPSRPTQFPARSSYSRRLVRMPSNSAESSYRSTSYARRPERRAVLPRPERSSMSSRTAGTSRSAAHARTVDLPPQPDVEQASFLDDTETLAPSDSISQASGKARRRRRRSTRS